MSKSFLRSSYVPCVLLALCHQVRALCQLANISALLVWSNADLLKTGFVLYERAAWNASEITSRHKPHCDLQSIIFFCPVIKLIRALLHGSGQPLVRSFWKEGSFIKHSLYLRSALRYPKFKRLFELVTEYMKCSKVSGYRFAMAIIFNLSCWVHFKKSNFTEQIFSVFLKYCKKKT